MVTGHAIGANAPDTFPSLPHIVKQDGPSQSQGTVTVVQGMPDMAPYIKGMEARILRDTHKIEKLRQNGDAFIGSLFFDSARHPCETALDHEIHALTSVGCPKKFMQLRLDTGKREALCTRCLRLDCREDTSLGKKAELCDKTAGPEHAQGIFRKTVRRRSYHTQDMMLKVTLSAIGIGQVPRKIHRHGIDRKVPSCQVFFQGLAVRNTARAVRIRSINFLAVGSNFNGSSFYKKDQDTEIFAQVFHNRKTRPFAKTAGFFRSGARDNIVVMGMLSAKQIAHGSANDIGFKSMFSEQFQNRYDI